MIPERKERYLDQFDRLRREVAGIDEQMCILFKKRKHGISNSASYFQQNFSFFFLFSCVGRQTTKETTTSIESGGIASSVNSLVSQCLSLKKFVLLLL